MKAFTKYTPTGLKRELFLVKNWDEIPEKFRSAFVVAITEEGRLVMVTVPEKKQPSGTRISLPGGGIEESEVHPLDTASREAYEEAKLTFVGTRALAYQVNHRKVGPPKVYVFMLATVADMGEFAPSSESFERHLCVFQNPFRGVDDVVRQYLRQDEPWKNHFNKLVLAHAYDTWCRPGW